MKVVAITGASRGIGRETAKLFVSKGWQVYNLSRRPAQEVGIRDLICDVTHEDEVSAAFARIQEECGQLDLLVNNAGYGIAGAVEFTSLAEARKQFEVNFFGIMASIKTALPLLKQSRGRIINISSAAAVFAIPFQAFYSASKASLNTLTNCLATELKPFGVSVCALQLGDVRTDFTDARQKSLVGDDVYGGVIGRSVAVMEQDEQRGMLPEEIAKAIYRIAVRGRVKPLYTVGAKIQLLVLLSKILPNSLVNAIIAIIYAK
jgi:NAD(P)-dependent dehydrogenase (short-subunit alcohol dehydrogenase family)